MYELNQEIIKKDHGYIVLYNRKSSPSWQTRIKINGVAKGTKKSCRTINKNDAHIFADKLYHSQVDKLKVTGTIDTKSFKNVYKEWIDMLEETMQPKEKIENFKENIERHSLDFWKSKSIDLITDREIELFVTWRREKYLGLKDTTLIRGFVPIKLLFQFAYNKGYINKIPDFPALKNKSNRRSAFNENEWQLITNKVDEWIDIAPKNQLRNRIYLKYYILIMGSTGIRPGTEIQSLKWCNLKDYVFKGEKSADILIHITNGKTGERETVPPRSAKTLLTELKQIRHDELKLLNIKFNEDEPIFCSIQGTGTASFKTSFATFLKHYNLLKDKNNKNRSPYSLRHTYATRMYRQGKSLKGLAKNMGTSMKLLESTYLHDDVDDLASEFLHATTPKYISTLF